MIRRLLLICMAILALTCCKKPPVFVGIAWRADYESESCINAALALKQIGAEVFLLPQVPDSLWAGSIVEASIEYTDAVVFTDSLTQKSDSLLMNWCIDNRYPTLVLSRNKDYSEDDALTDFIALVDAATPRATWIKRLKSLFDSRLHH